MVVGYLAMLDEGGDEESESGNMLGGVGSMDCFTAVKLRFPRQRRPVVS